jgi:ribosomal-protein-alanine N-acetyltransferase
MILDYNEINLSQYENNLIKEDTITKDLEINPFGKYLFYVEDKKIIGYIYYSDIYDRAEINQIEVDVSHRNCGKASILLKKAIELVDKSITLEVKIDNFPAIHLYEKYGFEKKAIRKGYYNGIDGILMERNNEK